MAVDGRGPAAAVLPGRQGCPARAGGGCRRRWSLRRGRPAGVRAFERPCRSGRRCRTCPGRGRRCPTGCRPSSAGRVRRRCWCWCWRAPRRSWSAFRRSTGCGGRRSSGWRWPASRSRSTRCVCLLEIVLWGRPLWISAAIGARRGRDRRDPGGHRGRDAAPRPLRRRQGARRHRHLRPRQRRRWSASTRSTAVRRRRCCSAADSAGRRRGRHRGLRGGAVAAARRGCNAASTGGSTRRGGPPSTRDRDAEPRLHARRRPSPSSWRRCCGPRCATPSLRVGFQVPGTDRLRRRRRRTPVDPAARSRWISAAGRSACCRASRSAVRPSCCARSPAAAATLVEVVRLRLELAAGAARGASPAGPGWCRPATRSAAASNATCTTAPSSGWSRSAWRSGSPSGTSTTARSTSTGCSTRASPSWAPRSPSCARSRTACARPPRRRAGRRAGRAGPHRADRRRPGRLHRPAARRRGATTAYYVVSEAHRPTRSSTPAPTGSRSARRPLRRPAAGPRQRRRPRRRGAVEGSGLAGLADRVAALGGTLRVSQPARQRHRRRGGAAVRIVIGEDSALFREGLARLLDRRRARDRRQGGGRAVAGRRWSTGRSPDLAIIDIRMPPDRTDDGARAARALRADRPRAGDRAALPAPGDPALGRAGRPRPLRLPAQGPGASTSTTSSTRCAGSPPGGSALDPEVVAGCSPPHDRDDPLAGAHRRGSARCWR